MASRIEGYSVELQMRFKVEGNEYMLQGNTGGQLPMFTVFGEKMSKMLEKEGQISMLQCFELQVVCHLVEGRKEGARPEDDQGKRGIIR